MTDRSGREMDINKKWTNSQHTFALPNLVQKDQGGGTFLIDLFV